MRYFLIGPTASGKGSLAVELASRINAEIVSLDSAKIYRGMDIGTAKPGPDRRRGVPFHMLDVVAPDEHFSVADYMRMCADAERDIAARGGTVLYAGGTAMYYQALTRGLFDGPEADPALRAELLSRAATDGIAALYRELAAVDPTAAAKIHPNDRKRVVRAIEVHRLTGLPISSFQNQWKPDAPPPADVVTVGISRERADLYDRINRRVDKMIANGLIDEVRRLAAQYGSLAASPASAIGYRETFAWLAGSGLTQEELTEEIKKNTRRFAKRQLTWFRHFGEVRWVTVAADDSAAVVADRALTLLCGEKN